jgi:rubrerythrin
MNAAEIARKMETDAVKFYKEAAEKTSHPVGKEMFISIMEDEIRHTIMIEAVLKGMDIPEQSDEPMEKVVTIFEKMKPELEKLITATSDDKEALRIAMEMEKKGFDFYQQAEAEATDEKTRALFSKLARDEDQHYRMFANTYNFLNDSGNWFMWEEKGVIEG